MDVEPFVKLIALAFAILAISTDSTAQGVQVFGVGIEIREDCEIVISHKNGQAESRKAPFSSTGKCRILPNSETNIPRLEFIQGEYVLLLESSATTNQTCRAELAAITVNRDGGVRLSRRTQQTSSCGSAERKDYEILRYHSRK
jgi:hypothetical protein